MNRKAMGYKPPIPAPPRPQSKPPLQKQSKPRPEWITDFSDADKYKLTESERIQRKASRQSSNRQAAKEQMAERMRKLQQGIIDEDTRKVYEVSLTSKGIDLNPPIRRNLSQMIVYEKEIQMQSRQQEEENQENEGNDVQKELKNTQQFIKRMEKANKVKNITQAIEILEPSSVKVLNMYSQNSSETFNKNKSTILGKSKTQQNLLNIKEELTPLQNIEGTMNFLQNLLKPRDQQNESLTLQLPSLSRNIHQQLQSFSKQIVGGVYHTERLQEDLNLISFEDKRDESPIPNRHIVGTEQNQWSNTIMRMHTLMENKGKQYGDFKKKDFEYTVIDKTEQQRQQQEFSTYRLNQEMILPSMPSLDDCEKEEHCSSGPLKNSYFRRLKVEEEYVPNDQKIRLQVQQEYYQSSPSMFSLNYSKRQYCQSSSSKQNTNRLNLEQNTQRSLKKQQQIQFSLTLNNSQLKIDTDRFFEPIHEEEEYVKSSGKPHKTSNFSRKPKSQNLVQQEQPQEKAFQSKHVTFKNQIMSKFVQPIQESDEMDFNIGRKTINTDFQRRLNVDTPMERRTMNPPVPQRTVLHQPNKEADKIRKLLQETKTNMSKLVTEKFEIPSSVSLKKQLR